MAKKPDGTTHSCQRNVKTTADWLSIPKSKRNLGHFFSTVSRLADWQRRQPLGGLFDNDEQVEGALRLAYQQYLDGMGRDTRHWIGITAEELDAWLTTRELPKRLRVKHPRPRGVQ